MKKVIILLVSFLMLASFSFAQSSSIKIKENTFVMKELFDVIKSQDRNTLLEMYPDFYQEEQVADQYSDYDIIPEEAFIYWYSFRNFFYYLTLDFKYESDESLRIEKLSKQYLSWNYGEETLTVTCEPYFMTIKSFQMENNTVVFNINSMYELENKFNLKKIQFNEWDHDIHTAKIVLDGDYVDLYIDDVFIHQFCRVTGETLHQYSNLINNNTCDLSKVTWPRHADGTSEYDDDVIVPEAIQFKIKP